MRQDYKASKGVVEAPRSGGGNMEGTVRANYPFVFEDEGTF